MSVQRFHVVCRRNNNPQVCLRIARTNPPNCQRLQWIRLPNVLLASWLPPSLLSLPIVIHWPQTFDTREGLSMVTPAAHQKVLPRPPDHLPFPVLRYLPNSLPISDFLHLPRRLFQRPPIYSQHQINKVILGFLLGNPLSSRTVTREIRLSFVAMGQVLGFLMVVVYHILQYLVVEYDMKVLGGFSFKKQGIYRRR